jgi:hypothetical protein
MCAQAAIFFSAKKKDPQKMREVYILCFEGGLVSFGVSQMGVDNGLQSPFTDFFIK